MEFLSSLIFGGEKKVWSVVFIQFKWFMFRGKEKKKYVSGVWGLQIKWTTIEIHFQDRYVESDIHSLNKKWVQDV